MSRFKVVKTLRDNMENQYVMDLENGDTICIPEDTYDTNILRVSKKGITYVRIVDEHPDDDSEPVEYLAFRPVNK